jgi:hypothetical protein
VETTIVAIRPMERKGMQFEARELAEYPESVPVHELKEGAIYFAVEFVDRGTFLPRLEPRVYIGRDLCPGDVGQLYFQDAASYLEGVRFGSAGSAIADATFVQTPEARDKRVSVFEYERALEILMSCSLRRRQEPVLNFQRARVE